MKSFEKEKRENIVKKGENAGDQHPLLFPQFFYPVIENNVLGNK